MSSWSGIDTWAAKVPELSPGTGVYHVTQGEITVGGLLLAKVENASIRVSNNVGRFTEVSKVSPTTFAGPISVDGRISSALVNLAMYRLQRGYAIGGISGIEPNYATYEDEDVKTIVSLDRLSFPITPLGAGAGEYTYLKTNFFPHPVNMTLRVNKDRLDQINVDEPDEATSQDMVSEVTALGALLNGGTISVRNGTAYIVNNMDFIARNAEWKTYTPT